jgi:hypothetical protein
MFRSGHQPGITHTIHPFQKQREEFAGLTEDSKLQIAAYSTQSAATPDNTLDPHLPRQFDSLRSM